MVARKRKIKWYTTKHTLSQALSSGLEYAFVSKKREQCCPFVLCKDFLQDAIYNQVYGTKKQIYGFKFDPKIGLEIALDKTNILLANSRDITFAKKIPVCLEFLNQIETRLKIAKTKVHECANPPKQYVRGGVWWFEGSSRWLSSPPMLSLYTLLIRVGFCHVAGETFETTIEKVCTGTTKPYQWGDNTKLFQSKKGLSKILERGDRKIFHKEIKKNYPKGVGISTLHNNLGIIGFSNGYTKIHVPYWHREEVEK